MMMASVLTARGRIQAHALRVSPLGVAVTESRGMSGRWSITHQPTGLLFPFHVCDMTRSKALAIFDLLEAIGDWRSLSDDVPYSVRHEVESFCAIVEEMFGGMP